MRARGESGRTVSVNLVEKDSVTSRGLSDEGLDSDLPALGGNGHHQETRRQSQSKSLLIFPRNDAHHLVRLPISDSIRQKKGTVDMMLLHVSYFYPLALALNMEIISMPCFFDDACREGKATE